LIVYGDSGEYGFDVQGGMRIVGVPVEFEKFWWSEDVGSCLGIRGNGDDVISYVLGDGCMQCGIHV